MALPLQGAGGMNRILSNTKGDRWIWLIVILLSAISLLAVYSSTGTLAYKKGVGVESILMKHLAMVVGGIALMYISHKLDYRYYAGISKLLMIVTIPLLLYTLVFGAHINNASRWIAIPGTGLSFQTSDLAKLALITYLARTLSRKQENIKDVKQSFIPIMGAVCLVFILIALANLSTALMLFGVSILLLIIGRISFKQISITCLAGAVLLAGVVFLGPRRHTYILRMHTFMHPEKVDADKSFQSDHTEYLSALFRQERKPLVDEPPQLFGFVEVIRTIEECFGLPVIRLFRPKERLSPAAETFWSFVSPIEPDET